MTGPLLLLPRKNRVLQTASIWFPHGHTLSAAAAAATAYCTVGSCPFPCNQIRSTSTLYLAIVVYGMANRVHQLSCIGNQRPAEDRSAFQASSELLFDLNF